MFVDFEFKGKVLSKDNAKAFNRRAGRFYIPKVYQDWEDEVKMQFLAQKTRDFVPLTGRLKAEIDFFFLPVQRTDLSNAPKSLLDALQGVAYLNDSQFVQLVLRKYVDRDRPGARIRIDNATDGAET